MLIKRLVDGKRTPKTAKIEGLICWAFAPKAQHMPKVCHHSVTIVRDRCSRVEKSRCPLKMYKYAAPTHAFRGVLPHKP